MSLMIPSPDHQKLVLALLNYFTSNNFRIISAAVDGYEDPVKQGRHEPDILAIDQLGVIQIAEAKLGTDLENERTREQFLDFSDRIMLNTRIPIPLHIVIYRSDSVKLHQVLAKLGLTSKIGNRIKIWTI